MNWKEFFRPTISKIILAIILFVFLGLILFYFFNDSFIKGQVVVVPKEGVSIDVLKNSIQKRGLRVIDQSSVSLLIEVPKGLEWVWIYIIEKDPLVKFAMLRIKLYLQ